MNYFRKRRLKKHILKDINWKLLDTWPDSYKNSGEYQALDWFRAYLKGRAGAEPEELFESALNRVGADGIDNRSQRLYLITLLEQVEIPGALCLGM